MHIRLVVLLSTLFAAVAFAEEQPSSSKVPVRKSQIVNYEPLPEIKHHFREPEKLPPQLISDAFTILCLAPMALLFIVVYLFLLLLFLSNQTILVDYNWSKLRQISIILMVAWFSCWSFCNLWALLRFLASFGYVQYTQISLTSWYSNVYLWQQATSFSLFV